MTTRLRKASSFEYCAATSRHAAADSSGGVVTWPRSSSDAAISSQSIAATGSEGASGLGCRLIGRLLSGGALFRQQLALAFDAPPIAAEIAIGADHPVARHEQRQLVRRAGLSHRPHRLRLAQRSGNLCIARRLAEWDLPQGPPYSRLERGAPNVERQVEIVIGRRDEPHDAIGPVPHTGLIGNHLGRRKALLQRRDEAVAVVGERGHADAALGRRDERPAQQRLDGSETDLLAVSAAAPGPGGHPEPRWRRLIGTRARPEAGSVNCLGNRLPGFEPLGEPAQPVRARIVPRRGSGDLLENSVKMKGADPGGTGELAQSRHFFAVI